MQRRLYAHRGAAAEQPENTIPSFACALHRGANALEMDVHASRDGVIVVSHDADGLRMCNEPRRIQNTSYEEIRAWDAGWGYQIGSGNRPFAGGDFQIPRFAEVLEAFPDTCINVDLKQGGPAMVKSMLRIVEGAKAEDRVTLASFSQSTLLRLRIAGYRGTTAMGLAEIGAALFLPSWAVRVLPLRGHGAQIPTRHCSPLATIELACKARIDKLHSIGARVDFWTINDVEQARALLALGADGIMTDDPKQVAPAFGFGPSIS